MCKPCMFSYWMGVWQTCTAKCREKRFNRVALSLSGKAIAGSLGVAGLRPGETAEAAVATWLDTNRADHFFELDSEAGFIHNGVTSQPALQLVSAKLMFASGRAAA